MSPHRLEFSATVEPAGPRGGSAQIRVPAAAAEIFGRRGLTPVRGTVNGYPIRTSIFPTGQGDFYLVLNREVREGAGIRAGDRVAVVLEPDPEPRTVEVPADFQAALAAHPAAQAFFDQLSPSHRREYVAWITEARRPETRARRIARAVEWLAAGKKEAR